MSKLQELIEKLCPNGVEYKTIGELASYRRGSFPQPYTNASFYGGEGSMPFVQVADIEDEGFNLKSKTKQTISKIAQPKSIFVPAGTVICSIQGTIGRVAITQYDSYVDRTIAIFEKLNDEIDKKYFAYCIDVKFGIEKEFARGSTLKTITKDEFTKFRIPVPPMEVQQKIVHILDDFTLFIEKLSLELEARKKQYRFYTNHILNNVDAEMKELGDVCEFLRGPFGGSLKKECFRDNGYAVYEQQHAIYQKLEFRYFVDEKKFDELKRFEVKPGELIVSCSGTIGKVFVIPENAPKGIINQALLKLKPKDSIKAEYIKYFFENTLAEQLNNSARGGAIKNVPSVAELKKIKILVPSIEEQEKIISLLNTFETLCNDTSKGLPAEIEKRQKQYEYYRDLLLNFKEVQYE